MRSLRIEQIAFGVVLVLVIGTATWFGVRSFRARPDSIPAGPAVTAGDYRPQDIVGTDKLQTVTWAKPKAQKRGREWVYGVFTPPEISYDPASDRFLAKSLEAAEAAIPEVASGFGLELLAVEPEEFPLQLVGYVGEPGHFLGTFENKVTYETLLLKTGDKVPSLGLTVTDFQVQRAAVEIPDSMTVNEYRATATVRADNSGKLTMLREGIASIGEDLRARLVVTGDAADIRVLRDGESTEVGKYVYTVDKIRLAPPTVDVTKRSLDTNGLEHQTLNPSANSQPSAP